MQGDDELYGKGEFHGEGKSGGGEGEVHEEELDGEREAHEGKLHRVEEVYRDSEGE